MTLFFCRTARRWFRPVGWGLVPALSLLLVGDRMGSSVPVSAADPQNTGHGTLVKYEALPTACVLPDPLERGAIRRQYTGTRQQPAASRLVNSPVRAIKDPYPSFASVAVDADRNEVVLTDESLFQILVYDRLENTTPGLEASKPKRILAGEETNIEFQSAVYVNPATGEIYAVNNDTRDTTLVFEPGAAGNVAPSRAVRTPHGTFGIAVAEAHDELFLSVQHDAGILTYRRAAAGNEQPIRLLQGDQTRLADPHGLAYDPKEDVIFVANFGSRSRRSASERRAADRGKATWPLERRDAVPGSGTIDPASITVYRRSASGNEAPLRVIEGPAAQLNWPTGVAFDHVRRELYVTSDMGHAVLVFDAAAAGNAAPKRVLKGPRTGLVNPTGIALDLKNRELWIANFGGHSATVYDLAASGDTPPRRTIRNAPPGTPSLMIGNPGAVTYDTKREEILVPN